MIDVPPIRPLSFSEILEDLQLDFVAEESVGGRSRAHALHPAASGDWLFQLFPDRIDPAPDSAAGGGAYAYSEAAAEAVSAAQAMSEEDRVAAELELNAAMTAGDLKRIRRAFALRNHPDLFHLAPCAEATSRMKIANMLIDRRRREIEAGR